MPPKLPRFRARAEQAQDAERLGRILEDDVRQSAANLATGGGDPRGLRGVPVVGVGSGVSPGTDPVRALLAKDSRTRRRR